MSMALLEDELERDFYALDPRLMDSVAQELVFKKLYYSINRGGCGFPLARKIA